jgi:hypothetical protein
MLVVQDRFAASKLTKLASNAATRSAEAAEMPTDGCFIRPINNQIDDLEAGIGARSGGRGGTKRRRLSDEDTERPRIRRDRK